MTMITYTDAPVSILDQGYVKLIGVYGNDAHIDYSARMSYEGARKVTDVRTLLRYLIRHWHWSPVEMAEVQFEIKAPLFVVQQLLRHRTANINQMSFRYSEAFEEFHLPELDDLKPQSIANKQGRDGVLTFDEADRKRQLMRRAYVFSNRIYRRLLGESGKELARETAREVLPVATYTKLTWKCDLRNFFNFLRLRLDKHAQKEIRVMAEAMRFLAEPHFKIAFEAFDDYILHAHTLSRLDQLMLTETLRLGYVPSVEYGTSIVGMTTREYHEFVEWFTGLTAPTLTV